MPILTKNNVVKNIYNVYYVSTLVGNLLSDGQLDSRGYDIRFHDTSCTIYGPNKAFIAKIKMTKNRLYPLEMRSGKLYAHNACISKLPSLQGQTNNSSSSMSCEASTTTLLPGLQIKTESSSSFGSNSNSDKIQRMGSLSDICAQDEIDNLTHSAFLSFQPTCFDEAVKEKEWVDAMNNKIDAIERNKTWNLVDLPANKNPVGVKWVYKTKLNEKGEIDKHKARLVAKGFSQQPGIDYGETFAPVARLDTVRFEIGYCSTK